MDRPSHGESCPAQLTLNVGFHVLTSPPALRWLLCRPSLCSKPAQRRTGDGTERKVRGGSCENKSRQRANFPLAPVSSACQGNIIENSTDNLGAGEPSHVKMSRSQIGGKGCSHTPVEANPSTDCSRCAAGVRALQSSSERSARTWACQ